MQAPLPPLEGTVTSRGHRWEGGGGALCLFSDLQRREGCETAAYLSPGCRAVHLQGQAKEEAKLCNMCQAWPSAVPKVSSASWHFQSPVQARIGNECQDDVGVPRGAMAQPTAQAHPGRACPVSRKPVSSHRGAGFPLGVPAFGLEKNTFSWRNPARCESDSAQAVAGT